MRSIAPLLSLLLLALACGDHARPTTVAGPEAPRGAPASSPLALTPDDALLVVAAPDHRAILVVERELELVREAIPLPSAPSHVIVDSRGLAVVSSEEGHAVDVVDPVRGVHRRRITVGVAPVGLTLAGPGVVAVALSGEDALAIVDVNAGRVTAKVRVADEPRAVARLPDGRLLVTHRDGTVKLVDLAGNTTHDVDLRTGTPALGMRPTLVGSVTVDVDGNAILPHSQANPVGILAPPPSPSCGYYSGCTGQPGAVVPSVSEVNPDPAPPNACAEACQVAGVDVKLLDPNDFRQALPALHNPVAAVLLDDGRRVGLLALGTQNVVILDRDDGYRFEEEFRVGEGAHGITVTRDGVIYTFNQFDHSLTRVERGRTPDTFNIASPVLPRDVEAGRRLFHTARDPGLAAFNAISCAACHPDGHADGMTWVTVDGIRNTPSLRGGLLATAPFHWNGNVATIEDLNRSTVVPMMGGSGMSPRAAVQLAAYLDRMPAPASPTALLPRTPDAVERGRRIFHDPLVGCASCHAGPAFTDNVNHDVGTVRTGDGELQTPSLRGLSRSAPYLHDGSAETLEEVVERLVATDKMGQGSHLGDNERADLVAYLRAL